MESLQIFKNSEFGRIRTMDRNGQIWFVGKDVAEILGYSNTRDALAKHIDDEDKGVAKCDTLGGAQDLTLINESGLYSLVLFSKLPSAKQFKRWVTNEVLPSIRKTGGYLAGQEQMSDTELMAKALLVAQAQIEQRNKEIGRLQKDNGSLMVQNQIMLPKAEYFDELVDRNLLTNFRDTAKELNIGEKTFIAFLLDKKYLYRDKKGKRTTYANKNNMLFATKECFNEKTQWNGTQTLVTPKGRETFRLLCQGIKQ